MPPEPPPKHLLTTTLFVTNLHCASCVSHAQDTLGPQSGVYKVDVNLLSNTICVEHEPGLTGPVTDLLLDAAFEVRHISTSDYSGRVISTRDVVSNSDHGHSRRKIPFLPSSSQKKHINHCTSCQSKGLDKGMVERLRSNFRWASLSQNIKIEPSRLEEGHVSTTVAEHDSKEMASTSENLLSEYTATISIGGMTCASCTNAVTNELNQIDFVQDVKVNLLSNNAEILFHGKQSDAQKLVDATEDVGFEASIDHVDPVSSSESPPSVWDAIISIEGMTCGSCVAAVTRSIEEVEGVHDVNVDLLNNNATIRVQDKALVDKVIEAVEDAGFEGSIAKVDQVENVEDDLPQPRTVDFEVSGMYCPMCPQNIVKKIRENFVDDVEIISEPTLKLPRISLRYKPASPTLTIRRLKFVIESADPVIVSSVYHPPSMEERSHAIQRKESVRILRHLLFTLVAAIPSFIIGIVFMSLVAADNPTRRWFEQPIWAGDAMRMDWAMFIVTTPVMFYGASIFHTRALREIWALWRPQSKVPVFKRLYRFGSMNLLISAGTSVAYFSSLAILIMEATASPKVEDAHMSTQTRHSITYFDTVTFLTLFILCGKFLQAYSKSKTGDAVAMLGKLRPSEALLVEDLSEKQEAYGKPTIRNISIDLLEIGDVVSIPHGASPPTDGVIDQDGSFLFDESSLTGESRPVSKSRGDTILTGSVNISDPVRISVKELGGKSMLDQIIAVVRSGQAKRAPVERFADIVTSYFTPVITFIAIATWIVWLSLGETGVLPQNWLDVDQGGWAFWSVEFAIAVFVVACPCGLGLAAPTALFVGGGLAAKAGILVQGGGEAFQEASQLDAIVFDKTGTLTEGRMRVTDMQMLDQEEKHDRLALHLVKALEDASTHPIAKAIVKYCDENLPTGDNLNISSLDIKETPGSGMQGTFNVHNTTTGTATTYEAAIGNERQLLALGVSSPNTYLTTTLNNFQSTGCSTAILSIRDLTTNPNQSSSFTPLAVLAITDPIRPEAPQVLSALRSQNIEIHMCTGDNATTALSIASQLSIPATNIRSNVLPQDKATYIQSLQTPDSLTDTSTPSSSAKTKTPRRRIIAFVGDGTNDTPALHTSDVSIALSSGSDIALTSASFILLNSNLTSLLTLTSLSRRVFRRVKLNFAWAAIYNVALIPVAAGVFFSIAQWRLSPVWAAAAMAGSSVSVVLSSLALRLPEVTLRRSGK